MRQTWGLRLVPDASSHHCGYRLEAVTKRYGFKDFAEYEAVAANIWLVMAQIDPQTKMFADPQILIKKEIEDASADKTIPDSERTVTEFAAAIC